MSNLKLTLIVFIGLIANRVLADEFESINLHGFKKEILSEKQIRYKDQSNNSHVIHLQISSFDPRNSWTTKTIKKDMEDMLDIRMKLYKALGYSDVQFKNYNLDKYQDKFSRLTISGNYKRSNKRMKYFSESNIYYEKNFLQIKILSDYDDIKDQYIENILLQINPRKLEIK